MLQTLGFNLANGNTKLFPVLPYGPLKDCSVIERFKDEAGLRRSIRILYRYFEGKLSDGDLAITRDATGTGYELWTYTASWTGRQAFYAGIIIGYRLAQRRKPNVC